MGIKSTSQGFPLGTDVAIGDALPTIGSAARQELQDVLNSTDSALEKLFADRNTLLADGGTISYSSGSLTTTTTFKLHLNSTSGTTPVIKTITGTSFTFDADGKMLYVTLDNRTASTTLSGGNVVSNSATLPDPTSSAQDVVLVAKRIGTQIYFRNGVIFDDGTTATMASSGGGAGTGEINVIENNSDATNWTATGTATVVTSTTAGDLPLGGVISTAIKIAAGAAADYVRYRWTMPAALKNKKLKVEWHQRPSSYTSGDFKVEVYKNAASDYSGAYTEFALSTDVSGTSSIFSGDGKHTSYFDGDSSDYYELRIVRVAGSSTLNIANVIVGPGIQPQGAVVGEWLSFTPSWTNISVGSGTVQGRYRRVGDSVEIESALSFAADTSVTGTIQVVLPTGLTAIAPASITRVIGTVSGNDSPTAYEGSVLQNTSNVISFRFNATTSDANATVPFTWGTGDILRYRFTVPIAEWAGSGTVNVAQNDVEYLYNSNTSTGASDTTSFAYGPGGTAFVAVSAPSSTIKKRVRAQRPIGANAGKPALKVSPDGILWLPAETIFPYMESGSDYYGMRIVAGGTAATDMDVEFGGDGATGTEAWSTYTSWKWVVVLEQPGVAVGFGIADTTSSGLVPSGTYNRTSGAWTLGPSSGASQVSHTVNSYSNLFTWGNGSLNLNNRNGSNAASIVFASNGSKNGAIYSSPGFPFAVQDSGTIDLGYVSSAGAWTLGAAGGVQVQQLNGALQFSTGSNTPVPTYGLRRNGSNALEFFTNSTSAGYVDSSGNFNVGPITSTFSADHTFNGRVASTGGSYSGVVNATTFDLLSNTNIAASTCWYVHAWATTASAGEYVTAFIHRPSSGIYFIRTLSSSGLSLGIGGSNQVQGTNNSGATRDIKWSALRIG